MIKFLIFAVLFNVGCSNTTKIVDDKAQEISSKQQKEKSPNGSLSAEEVYEKLKPLALKSKFPTKLKHKDQFSITLPSDKERGDEKSEWIFSNVKVFFKDTRTVDQIVIQTENCNVAEEKLNKKALEDRVVTLVKTVSAQIFGIPFNIPRDRYFKELGPYWNKGVRVPIDEPYSPVRSMRLIRGKYKCDSRGGYGFRYDFFI